MLVSDLELLREELTAYVVPKLRYYEQQLIPYRLFYHVNPHTATTRRYGQIIGTALGLSHHNLGLVDVACACHDLTQDSIQVTRKDGALVRQRLSGLIEGRSASQATEFMVNATFPFMYMDYGIVNSAIIATIPTMSHEHGTVIQEFLTETSHLVVRVTALADLCAAGMNPKGFLQDTMLLFAEENNDMMLDLLHADSLDEIGVREQDWYRERIITCKKQAVGFAEGRKLLLPRDLRGLSATHRNAVMSLFCHFDATIAAAEQAVREAERMSFKEMVVHMLPTKFRPGA